MVGVVNHTGFTFSANHSALLLWRGAGVDLPPQHLTFLVGSFPAFLREILFLFPKLELMPVYQVSLPACHQWASRLAVYFCCFNFSPILGHSLGIVSASFSVAL